MNNLFYIYFVFNLFTLNFKIVLLLTAQPVEMDRGLLPIMGLHGSIP